jgi:LysR family glycine cleavage system transcriptional activator
VGARYRRLVGEVLVPACSPRLLQRGAPIACARDLTHHTLLSSVQRPMDRPRWLGAAGCADLETQGGIRFDNAALAFQGASNELGVAIAVRAMVVEDDLRSGRLVAPFTLQVATQGAYYLVDRFTKYVTY